MKTLNDIELDMNKGEMPEELRHLADKVLKREIDMTGLVELDVTANVLEGEYGVFGVSSDYPIVEINLQVPFNMFIEELEIYEWFARLMMLCLNCKQADLHNMATSMLQITENEAERFMIEGCRISSLDADQKLICKHWDKLQFHNAVRGDFLHGLEMPVKKFVILCDAMLKDLEDKSGKE